MRHATPTVALILVSLALALFAPGAHADSALDYFNAANRQVEAGKLDRAIGLYNKAIEADAAFGPAYVNLGNVHLLRGEDDLAAEVFARAIEKSPNDPNPYSNLGLIFLRRGLNEKATQMFREALGKDEANYEARYNLANALLRSGKADDALAELDALIGRLPDAVDPRVLKGRILAGKGDLPAAVAIFRDALARAKGHRDATNELALALMKQKKHAEAVPLFESILEERDQEAAARVLYNLALCHQNLGEAKKSEEHFRQALFRSPNFAEVRNDYGSLLFELGRVEEARDQFRQAFRTDPTLVAAGMNYAKCSHILGQNEAALETLQFLAMHNPGNAPLYDQLGLVYFNQKRFDFARAAFEKAIEIAPALDSAHYNLGVLHDEEGKYDLAIESYKKAIALNGEHILALNNLGYLFLNLKRYDDAIAQLSRAVRVNDRFTWAHYNLALAYYNRGNKDRAAKAIDAVLAHEPPDTKLHEAARKVADLVKGR